MYTIQTQPLEKKKKKKRCEIHQITQESWRETRYEKEYSLNAHVTVCPQRKAVLYRRRIHVESKTKLN